jgi:hypothetical protein
MFLHWPPLPEFLFVFEGYSDWAIHLDRHEQAGNRSLSPKFSEPDDCADLVNYL